jgi:hypothetical protein
MAAASLFAKRTIESGFDAKFIDVTRPQEELLNLPSLIVIHNLTPDVEFKYLHMVRGMLYAYQECFCITVAGGINGLSFFDHKIRRPVHACIHFEGQLGNRSI